MKKIILAVIVVLLLGAGFYFYRGNIADKIDDITPTDKTNLIVVFSPLRDAPISSPLSISGRARGTWYFEGSFPLVLLDAYGHTIAEGHASSQGEWMTEEFVSFLGTLEFNNYIKGSKGTLVLKKDNPSGLPEHDDSIEIPVTFK